MAITRWILLPVVDTRMDPVTGGRFQGWILLLVVEIRMDPVIGADTRTDLITGG
jgi:hypothetical protein